MVNASLVETILREQNDPGASTSRKIRELYNNRSGEEAIAQHTDEDKEFQSILLRALEAFAAVDDEEKPISYTVKLKDSVENITPAVKRRSIIKLPKENKSQSESDDASSDTEKIPTASSITITKPFSPLFLNNMKKFGVSSDWLATRSNSVRHSSYSRSSIKSNTNKLDAMIKSASAKPIRSNRKLSFIEDTNNKPVRLDFEKENADPADEVPEQQEEPKEEPQPTVPEPSPYDLSSEVEEDEKDDSSSPSSNAFSLRIPRVSMKKKNRKRVSSSSSNEDSEPKKTETKKKRNSKKKPAVVETKPESPVVEEEKKKKKKRISKKKPAVTETKPESPVETKEEQEEEEEDESAPTITSDPVATKTAETSKKTSKKKENSDPLQARIENLKKLLRTSGIRLMIKKTELEELPSDKARIKYLKSLFDTAGFTGSLSLKDCRKFREKRDGEKELIEIQASAVDVKGHVKGGRTLRGQGRMADESDSTTSKRKRAASTDVEDNVVSSEDDDDKPMAKKRRILKMEASPEVSETELD